MLGVLGQALVLSTSFGYGYGYGGGFPVMGIHRVQHVVSVCLGLLRSLSWSCFLASLSHWDYLPLLMLHLLPGI